MDKDGDQNLKELHYQEQSNYKQLWEIFVRNSLTPHFKNSLYAGLGMFLVPTSVNIYFIFRDSLLKNSIRLTTIFSSIIFFQYYLNRDFETFIKFDQPDSNRARQLMQNISYHNILFPWFGEETKTILGINQRYSEIIVISRHTPVHEYFTEYLLFDYIQAISIFLFISIKFYFCKKMSLAPSTQTHLAKTILSIAEAEKLTEACRQALAQLSLFESYTAFRRLDQQRSGQLTLSNLIEFLDDNSVPYTQNQATYLFKKLDNDKDGRISYNDFQHFVLSKGDGGLRQLTQLRESYFIGVNMLLPADVEKALADLFSQEIQNHIQLQPVKDQLVNSLDYSSLEAFKTLDLFNQGYLTIDSLKAFMNDQEVPIGQEELFAFFRAVDSDEDGRISYAELVESVHLMEPLPYRPTQAVEQVLRESQLQRSLDRSRALERVYLNYYPYYVYPYSISYYPTYYPYLTISDLRLRDSSLERLRDSSFRLREASLDRLRDSQIRLNSLDRLRDSQIRLSSLERLSASRTAQLQIDRDLRLSRLMDENRSAERVREYERQLSLERLRQIQDQSIERQIAIDQDSQIRRVQQVQREDEIRHSLERVRRIGQDARLRQLNSDKESHFLQIERESRIRQLQVERRLIESEVRQSSLERLNSLERLHRLEMIRHPYIQSSYYLDPIYDPIYINRYVPMSSVYQETTSKSQYVLTPQKQSPKSENGQKSGLKVEEERQEQQQQEQVQEHSDKQVQQIQGVRKSLNEQQGDQKAQ